MRGRRCIEKQPMVPHPSGKYFVCCNGPMAWVKRLQCSSTSCHTSSQCRPGFLTDQKSMRRASSYSLHLHQLTTERCITRHLRAEHLISRDVRGHLEHWAGAQDLKPACCRSWLAVSVGGLTPEVKQMARRTPSAHSPHHTPQQELQVPRSLAFRLSMSSTYYAEAQTLPHGERSTFLRYHNVILGSPLRGGSKGLRKVRSKNAACHRLLQCRDCHTSIIVECHRY